MCKARDFSAGINDLAAADWLRLCHRDEALQNPLLTTALPRENPATIHCGIAIMLVCWKCGTSLEALSLPLMRLDVCKACNAELHACKLCEFYDIGKAKHCREPIADEVRDKERANFCDYFKPRANAFSNKQQSEAERARGQLEALFGKK